MAKVTIDFWEPIDAGGLYFNLLAPLRALAAFDVPRRMRDRGTEYTDFLDVPHLDEHTAIGRAARIRKENLPQIIDLATGEFRPQDLPEGEGLAEVIHFLFDQRLHVLLTQRNRVFRVSAFVDLACEISGALFDLQPKLRRDAWRRFTRMERIGSIELKLQRPEHHPDLSQVIPPMGRFLDRAANEINAYSVDIKLSVERSRTRSLDRGIIRRIADAFRREDNITKLVATGRQTGEERSEIVDFIKDRLVHAGEVQYDGRHLDREQCERLLRQALERHRAYLATLL